MSQGLHVLRGLALASALASTPACKVPDLLERARSPSDANLEPPPTDPVPEGPGTVHVADGADWIQRGSGEWRPGELLRVRDDSLDFDSDKLDLQTFDRDDVMRIHSAQTDFVVTDDNRLFSGRLVVDGQKVWVISDRTVQIDRSELLAVVAAGDSDKGRLSGSLNLGFAVRSGNTDQVDLTGGATVLLERARSRAQARYSGVISTVQDVETANNHRLTSTLDLYLTERAFVTLPGIELYRDKVQNIDLRTRPYAALGYKLVDTLDQKLRVSAGPAYQSTRLEAGSVGEASTDDTLAGVLSSEFDWEITSDIELNWSYSLTVPFPDTAANNHNMVTSLSVDLTDDLELDVSFVWDRVNRPAADASGEVPLPDDLRTTIGINWAF